SFSCLPWWHCPCGCCANDEFHRFEPEIRLKKTLLAAATAAALAMFAAPVALAQDATRYGTWGIDTAGMDPEADPGEDFFRYVSGNWADTTEIPADRS